MLRQYDAWLAGYYGMQNCGDDALLLAAHYGAQQHLGCQNIAVASMAKIKLNGQLQLPKTLQAQQHWRGQNRLIQYQQALQSKRIILGGGSVFHSAQDINIKRHMLRLSNSRQSMALGVSLGPFYNSDAESACRKFLNECGFIGVRDAQSFEIACSLAPNANVKQTFDLAPSLMAHPDFRANQNERAGILFNLCPVAIDANGGNDPQAEQRRVNAICTVIAALWKRTGERISLINLNGHNQLGDWQLSQKIRTQLRDRVPLSLIPYNSNPLKVIQVMSHFKAIVSMRLHGNIFAYMTGTPSIALNYHRKCQQWCEQIGLPPAQQFDAANINQSALLSCLENGLNTGFETPQLPVATALTLSESNWRTQDEKHQVFSRRPALQ